MGPHDSGGVHCAARTARPPLFRIRDASVVRAGSIILHVDDFTLAEGEHLALLGPNGAGKSTFIKLLTREVMPLYRDAAPVVFRGNERPTLADIKSCFGVVSASMHEQISVHLPVIDIVCGGFFGTLGLPRGVQVDAAMRAASLDALEKLGIADLSARDVLTLSTGQVRRVLVARELVHDPQVLVFDEPCTGLDPQGMYQIRSTMRALAEEGRSVVLVTHYPEDIVPAIERVVLIKDAAILADGSKRDLLTDETMSDLFDAPLRVEERDGWYAIRGVF
ncbi:ABC transporter ATP-binding protein [uncultured Slackia sp.]|uniref:ABC transporter ATP-binding protein n=1 Tax=uncultured Slackia sp. TaxID=665903 RepID=UPI0026DF2561|nr:ATP-binding cassette domain-containing protein [uncultured Slackia sp.]